MEQITSEDLTKLVKAVRAAKSIVWMARKYADGGGPRSIEMETYRAAEELIVQGDAVAEMLEPRTRYIIETPPAHLGPDDFGGSDFPPFTD